MHKDPECAERDPEIEVRMVEEQREDKAEDRGNFAKRAAENEAGLHTSGVAFLDGSADVLTAEFGSPQGYGVKALLLVIGAGLFVASLRMLPPQLADDAR